MKNLVIIGTGGFARETYYGAKNCLGYNEEWTVKGFIKDAAYKEIENFEAYCPESILGTIDDYVISKDDVFFCAVGDIDLKIRFVGKIKEKGGKFINMIHRTADILEYVTLGEGVCIGLNTAISCNVKIGDHTYLGTSGVLGHDVVIGDFCQIGAFTHFGGFSSIGSRSIIHPHAIVLPKVSVAENTVIGAGSLVVRKVKTPNQTWFGSPAKPLV